MMKTIEIKLYKFEELSEAAQKKAIDNYRNNQHEDFWDHERYESYKRAGEIYKRLHNIDAEINGARLYTWIQNNIIEDFIKPNYISKHTNGTFKNSDYAYKYDCIKFRRSRIFTTNNLENYPLTGVCYDFDFLQPIIEFVKNPDKYTSNEDLTIPDYEGVAQKDYDYQNTDEYIIEELEANDYDFTAEGEIY